MDKISDFFKDIKERLSNPLFFSFIISWLIFNWKLPIVLLFYKQSEIKLDGYSSYIDFISKNINSTSTIWKPLAASIIYTFIFPFFRNCILAFSSWIKAWGNTWNLTAAKASKVSISKYMQLRDIYQTRTTLLQEVLDKESAYLEETEEVKNKLLQMTSEKNAIYQELEQWKSSNNVNLLNGQWEFYYSERKEEERKIYRVYIHNGTIEFLDTPPTNKNGKTIIKNFYTPPKSNQIAFTTVYENGKGSYVCFYFFLNVLDNMNVLRGYENDQHPIEFRKIR